MADEKSSDSGGSKKNSGGDQDNLGNLPPLSDFDSGGFKSDKEFPPLEKKGFGGLPPIDDISEETPAPTGGNIKPAPPTFSLESDAGFGGLAFDERGETPRKGGRGFQSSDADSDFSPETPEIGPGPEADIDTPMFDSAFGGASSGGKGFTPPADTPAPTRSMETPMFPGGTIGGTPPVGGSPFDTGAFEDFRPGMETPAPDFTPTGMEGRALGMDDVGGSRVPEGPPKKPAKEKKGLGAKGVLVAVLVGVVGLLVGIFMGGQVSTKFGFIPNPFRTQLADKEAEVTKLNATIKKIQESAKPGTNPAVTPEKINELLDQQKKLTDSLNELTGKQKEAQDAVAKTAGELDQVKTDLETKNEEFVKAQEAFEDLQNQTSIVQARQLGLVAEVERLSGLVGTMEEANQRARATKETLQASVNELLISVKEGIPLTPEKYARAARVAAVDSLKAKVDEAKWVSPELLSDYTNLYLKELDIAACTAYFFAHIPVTNKINEREVKWAECLMKGNWAVYFRTVDGKNTGSYENTAQPGEAPHYEFRELLPGPIRKQIEDEIFASRTPGFENKVKALAEKQTVMEGPETQFQKVFNSL
ncbi:MAG: hypothetical protein NTU83_00715 [Candidatus Hydrogenedentes bacterium]|nr:hypothetical protein [Candidatus Hydrogenedentota bacterium]